MRSMRAISMAEAFDVAIIGSGPAGLGAALALRSRGVAQVIVLEREEAAGGVPRHCAHSPFGMREFHRVLWGPAYAARLVQAAREAGVEIRVGITVTALGEGGRLAVTTPAGESEVAARRVILATGARETPRSARLVGGDRPLGVLTTGTLQQAVHLEGLLPFRSPVIVGTELVSLSAMLTCRAAGIRPVAAVETGPRPTARQPLGLLPRLLGIPLHLGADITEIHGRGRVEGVTVRLADGSAEEIACDGVLFTGRFVPEASLVRDSALRLDDGSGGPAIDQFGRTSDPFVFAAGNLLRPVETGGWSYREGQAVGRCVAEDLAGRLPSGALAAVRRGRGLKLVVPQCVSLPLIRLGLDALQLRSAQEISGSLVARINGRAALRRSMHLLPERRALVPLAALAGVAAGDDVTIGFEE
jgi:thioredoxin reductase